MNKPELLPQHVFDYIIKDCRKFNEGSILEFSKDLNVPGHVYAIRITEPGTPHPIDFLYNGNTDDKIEDGQWESFPPESMF